MSIRKPPAVVLIGMGLSAVAGCDGIVDPAWWTHQMVIYAALNPRFHPASHYNSDDRL